MAFASIREPYYVVDLKVVSCFLLLHRKLIVGQLRWTLTCFSYVAS